MSDTPTPAPALTDEQVDNMAGTFCDAYLRTLPPFGHPVGKDLFHRWYAAVIARAKREAAEDIAAALKASAIALGDQDSLNNSQRALRNGLMLGAQLALQEPTR